MAKPSKKSKKVTKIKLVFGDEFRTTKKSANTAAKVVKKPSKSMINGKLALMKYSKKLRKHVLFTEAKIK